MERALGKLVISEQHILNLFQQGQYMMEERLLIPEKPLEVHVHSVHKDPSRFGFIIILESRKPVDKWTQYVPLGEEIPLSPISLETKVEVVDNTKDPAHVIKHMSLKHFMNNLVSDIEEDGDSGVSLNMSVHDYIKLLKSYE